MGEDENCFLTDSVPWPCCRVRCFKVVYIAKFLAEFGFSFWSLGRNSCGKRRSSCFLVLHFVWATLDWLWSPALNSAAPLSVCFFRTLFFWGLSFFSPEKALGLIPVEIWFFLCCLASGLILITQSWTLLDFKESLLEWQLLLALVLHPRCDMDKTHAAIGWITGFYSGNH